MKEFFSFGANMRFGLILILFIFISSVVYGETVYLKNGDKVTGEITKETDESLEIQSDVLGTMNVKKEQIERREGTQTEAKKAEKRKNDDIQWEKTISLGYSMTGGNTNNSLGTSNIKLNRKTKADEWTWKFDSLYSSSENKINGRKFYSMLRYAQSFGQELKFYRFGKFEADQDRFTNIDYRLIPSAGLGYWFSDEENWKFMTEAALGYEYINYRMDRTSEGNITIIPRLFLEKKIYNNLRFTEDTSLYPSLGDIRNFRVRSESAFINPISDKLSIKFSFIEEYNSAVIEPVEKNDYRIVSALEYSF
jgi:putative salt-induced outer membrane protein YdiY